MLIASSLKPHESIAITTLARRLLCLLCMTTIDHDKLVTAGGVTMGPNGEGCIRPQPGLPGPRLPLGKQAGGM